MQVTFQYNGNQKTPAVAHVIVNGGPFYADIPIVIIVKDLPYESIDLYSNAPQKVVKPGTTTNFVFSVNNKYAQGKTLLVNISKPAGWGASTLNGSIFYTYEGQIASSDLWVYVPKECRARILLYERDTARAGHEVKHAPVPGSGPGHDSL